MPRPPISDDGWPDTFYRGEVDFGNFSLPRHRFYLFALNAYGYLLARLGRKEEAEQALSAVMRLDPNDRIGSGQLRDART